MEPGGKLPQGDRTVAPLVVAEMAPQPVQEVLGGLRPASQPARKTSGELDEERKQELIMEKKLRACRVSILPKVSALGKM